MSKPPKLTSLKESRHIDESVCPVLNSIHAKLKASKERTELCAVLSKKNLIQSGKQTHLQIWHRNLNPSTKTMIKYKLKAFKALE